MKAYTDLEQSKKLAEILPLESADMFWPNAPITVPCIKDGNPMGVNIPCWSLAALLSIIPKHIGDSVFRMDMGETDINLWFDDLSSRTVDEILPDIAKDNPVDACYEMIVRLKENNKI